MNKRLKLGAALVCLPLLAGLWYVSPAGWRVRLRRMPTAELVAYSAQHPNDDAALLELAQRLEEQALYTAAAAAYLQAARLHPRDTALWLGACRAATRAGDGVSALDAAQRAVATAATPGARSRAQSALGAVYVRGGDWSAALTAFQQASGADPANAEAQDGIAQVALQRKRPQDALRAAQQATRLDPQQCDYWIHLARALRASGDLPGARAAISQALHVKRQQPEALTELGIVLMQMAHSPTELMGAEYPLQYAVRNLTGTPQSYEPAYQLGQLYLLERKYLLAEGALRQALTARPEDEAAMFALNRSLALQGKTREASDLLRRFQQESRYRLVESQLKMRLGREPQRADLLARLAQLYADHERWQEATAVWQRCLQIEPGRSDWSKRWKDAQRRAGAQN